MNCLVFSESYPLQLKDDDFQIDAVTDSKHLLSSIRAHSFVLVLIEARLLCALDEETLSELQHQKHLVLVAEQIEPCLFPILTSLSFERLIPEQEFLASPKAFIRQTAREAATKVLADSNSSLEKIVRSGSQSLKDGQALSMQLRMIDIQSLYLLFFCASRPFKKEHLITIQKFASTHLKTPFAPVDLDGEIILLCPIVKESLLEQLVTELKRVDCIVEYGIGISRHISLQEKPDFLRSFQEAKLSTMINFYQKQEVSFYFENLFQMEYDYVSLIQSEKEITNAILTGYSEEELFQTIDRYIACFTKHSILPKLVYEAVFRFFNSLDRMFKFIDPLCTINLEDLTIHDFEQYGTIDDLHQALNDMLSFTLKKGENYTQTNTRTLREIKNYLDDHLNEAISLDLIEQRFYVNKYVFCRQFKKYTGQTFGNYIKSQRLYKAKDMLENSHTKIYEIAQLLGFKDESYFSAVFKKHFHLSPSEYRALHQKSQTRAE